MARPPHRLDGLVLARAGLDRRGDLRARPDLLLTLLADPSTLVLDVIGDTVPVLVDEDRAPRLAMRPPAGDDDPDLAIFLGMGSDPEIAGSAGSEASTAYLAVMREAGQPPAGAELRTLRAVGAHLGDVDAGVFTTALALANWHRTHGHCPRCGALTVVSLAGWTRRCPADDSEHYPRTDPAVIMSVTDDADRILLARGRGFRSGGMSVLAGFVEPGESLAAAVVREVAEEVGVAVADVTYLGDQPWPFPSSLMVGFTARALGTELTLQDEEIAAARWFTRDELTAAVADGSLFIPPRVSIARRLVEHWYGREIAAPEVALRG